MLIGRSIVRLHMLLNTRLDQSCLVYDSPLNTSSLIQVQIRMYLYHKPTGIQEVTSQHHSHSQLCGHSIRPGLHLRC